VESAVAAVGFFIGWALLFSFLQWMDRDLARLHRRAEEERKALDEMQYPTDETLRQIYQEIDRDIGIRDPDLITH